MLYKIYNIVYTEHTLVPKTFNQEKSFLKKLQLQFFVTEERERERNEEVEKEWRGGGGEEGGKEGEEKREGRREGRRYGEGERGM